MFISRPCERLGRGSGAIEREGRRYMHVLRNLSRVVFSMNANLTGDGPDQLLNVMDLFPDLGSV